MKVISSRGIPTTSPAVSITPGSSFNAGTVLLAAPDVVTSTLSGLVEIAGVAAPDAALAGHMVLLTSENQAPLINLTDENGNFAFIVRAGGAYRVTPIPEEYDSVPFYQNINIVLGENAALSQTFALQADPVDQVNFMVDGSVTKNGKAFDEADEGGVPLTLSETSTGKTYAAITTADGSFNFEVPTGEYELAVGGGYTFETPLAQNPFPVAAPLTVDAFNIVPTKNVIMVQGSIFKNSKTLGETDEAGVALMLTSIDAVTYPSVTDADGNFTFFVPAGDYNLSIGGAYQFVNHPFAGSPLTVPVNAAQQAILNVPLEVTPIYVAQQIVSVRGYVQDAGTNTIAGVNLTLTDTADPTRVFTAISNAIGDFSFEVLPGNYELSVVGQYQPAAALAPFNTDPSGLHNLGPITVVSTGITMVRVQGQVSKNPSETDDSGVNLTLTDMNAMNNVYSAMTNAGDYYSFEVPSGTYLLEVVGNYISAPGSPFDTNDASALNDLGLLSVSPVEIIFTVSGAINKTTMVPGDSGPVELLLRSPAVSYETITSDGNNFEFKVRPGIYNLEITGLYQFNIAPAPIDASSGNVFLGTLNVSPSTSLDVVIGGAITAATPESFEVRLWDEVNSKYAAQTTSVRDVGIHNYRFAPVPPGTYRVMAFPHTNGFFAETPIGSPIVIAAGEKLLNHNLLAVKMRPEITSSTISGNIISLAGSDFSEPTPNPSATGIFVSNNRMPRPAPGSLIWVSGTSFTDEANVSSLPPGDYFAEVRRNWSYVYSPSGVSEDFVLRSNGQSFSKNIQPPSNLVFENVTDHSARITWRNAPWTQATDIEIFNVTDAVSFNTYNDISENFFEVTGLAANKTYEARLWSKAGSKISTVYAAPQFTTKKTTDYQIQTIPLVNSGALLSNGTVLDFMSVNDTYYVLNTDGTNLVITRFASAGARIDDPSIVIFASAAAPSRDQASMAYGGGLIFICYSDQTNVIVNAYNPADLTTPVGTRTIPASVETQMIYAGGGLFVACTYYGDTNIHQLVYFDNPANLSANTPQTAAYYTSTTLTNPAGSDSYLTMVCADAANVYFAFPVLGGSYYDAFTIDKLSLSNPMAGPTDQFQVSCDPSMSADLGILQFKTFDGQIYARTGYDYGTWTYQYYEVDSVSGYLNQKTSFPFSERGDLGVDSKGRVWMAEDNSFTSRKFFVQVDRNGTVSKSLNVPNDFISNDGLGSSVFPNPANYIKLDPVSNSMNLMFKDSSEALSVYRYSSEY